MKRSLRLLVAMAALALITLGFAGTAGAQSYAGGTITTGTNVAAGSTDTVTGSGFTPGATVTVTLGAEVLGTVVVASDGTFALTYTVPSTCGSYTITATDGTVTQTTTLTVACAASAGALPYTGNDSSLPLAQIGAGLLAAGAVIALTVRKRQHAPVKVDA